MTNDNLLVQPILVLMILTMGVWLYMYVVRNRYVMRQRINPQLLASPEQLNTMLPEHINRPSNNLKNLCELPVLFYALCLLIQQLALVDTVFVTLAWCFVGLRIAHSLVHCTFNYVLSRFVLYVSASLVLWGMLLRFSWLVI